MCKCGLYDFYYTLVTLLLYLYPPHYVQVWTLEDGVLEGGGEEGGNERSKLIDESDEGTYLNLCNK